MKAERDYQNEKTVLDESHGRNRALRDKSPTVDPESGIPSTSIDNDVAAGLVGERAQEIDEEVEKRVLRKIDLFLIPAMVVGKGFFLLCISIPQVSPLTNSIPPSETG